VATKSTDATPNAPWRDLRRHLRVWRRFVALAVVREMQHRGHFAAITVSSLMLLVLALVPVWLLYGFTDRIAGWTQAEMVVLVGVYRLVDGVLNTFVAPNMQRFSAYIQRGDLDLVLTRPVSSQFYVSLRWMNPAEAINVVIGLAVAVIGLRQGGIAPSPAGVVAALVLVACGTVLVSCAWSACVYLVFWLSSVEPVWSLFQDVWVAGKYPVTFFPPIVRAFFTVLVPTAFATTFPAQALVGEISAWLLPAGIGLTVVALLLTRAYWRYALRFYASASS
jgi:ABC-2 type transport system permease protein